MKRTCCFTTPKGTIIIFSNMEFHMLVPGLEENKISTGINVLNALPNIQATAVMSVVICCICRNRNGNRLLKNFSEGLETGKFF